MNRMEKPKQIPTVPITRISERTFKEEIVDIDKFSIDLMNCIMEFIRVQSFLEFPHDNFYIPEDKKRLSIMVKDPSLDLTRLERSLYWGEYRISVESMGENPLQVW